jgi:abequosyltransferase
MLNPKLLSLVIPTYNRSSYLDRQVAWAVESIGELWPVIELVICDNASTDKTTEICENWKDDKIKVFRNNENVGLVRNCLLGVERASASFVWLVGDDDPIEVTAVRQVVSILQEYQELDIIHINHRCISGLDDSVITSSFYDIKEDIISQGPGNGILTKLLQDRHTGGFMFITANIVNRHSALEFINKYPPNESELLAYPLLLNAGLASIGKFYLLHTCLIDCVYYQSSWNDKYYKVAYEEVPVTIRKLHDIGLGKQAALHCLNYQFKDLYSIKDVLYKFKKLDIKFIFSQSLVTWAMRWLFKQKIRWQIQYQ